MKHLVIQKDCNGDIDPEHIIILRSRDEHDYRYSILEMVDDDTFVAAIPLEWVEKAIQRDRKIQKCKIVDGTGK